MITIKCRTITISRAHTAKVIKSLGTFERVCSATGNRTDEQQRQVSVWPRAAHSCVLDLLSDYSRLTSSSSEPICDCRWPRQIGVSEAFFFCVNFLCTHFLLLSAKIRRKRTSVHAQTKSAQTYTQETEWEIELHSPGYLSHRILCHEPRKCFPP